MPSLGIVDSQGRVRFSGDINDCRAFLRSHGLECTHKGWEGNGFGGILEFWKGSYHACVFKI